VFGISEMVLVKKTMLSVILLEVVVAIIIMLSVVIIGDVPDMLVLFIDIEFQLMIEILLIGIVWVQMVQMFVKLVIEYVHNL
jgi:hypothetical protein